MPTSSRKSSVGGARRGLQKAHIPYRGDNPEVGKKTGISVAHVERKSDGFEPFDELIQQIDGRTPPRPKAKRKQSISTVYRKDDDYDDEDGEQSMQLDSPVRHLVNLRPPTTPTASGRSRTSIRPVARTSDVDFDRIPSPHLPNSTRRGAGHAGPGPSSLRHSAHDLEPEPQSQSESQSDNEPAGDYTGEAGYDNNNDDDDDDAQHDNFDDHGQRLSPKSRRGPRQSNFSAIEEEDEEEAADLNPDPEGVEDEIAQGLKDVDLDMESSAEDSEPEPEPPMKKRKVVEERKTAPTKTQTRSKKENRPHREGVRRSQREHIRPLEYWRGEKVVYGRTTHSGPVLVPPIKEILRIPKEDALPLGAKRKRGSTRPRSRSRAVDHHENSIPPALAVHNPEEGWDDDTSAICTVLHFTTKDEVERRIAWTAKMVEPRMAADKNWSFDKIFGDDDFIAAGQLIIPPRGRKPSKAAKDNTYVFYVIEGAVNFKIHQTSMILATGGMFMVPRGNTYLIENISERNARLFFTQARKVAMNSDEKTAKAEHIAEMQRRKSLMRSSSAGAPSIHSTKTPGNPRAASMATFPPRS
ncbi:Inner kinetochore subunit cnp3 [Psilocybe cubensis]|uniref:Inner kinetochore subunit cnp3 n=2 Tax=Psilocybe cubensis TaxID=181762 RepID=A0ACB8H4J2_PSICU|nr:Inner kinetochore subunit cnp3 [Psilocybe cubensis]KAH9482624.1 Inner kinetochore subunit cnp3 [Psilocybe cubensis]